MSQALTGRTESTSIARSVEPRHVRPSGGARRRARRCLLQRLLLCLGFICAATSATSAQRAQTVKSTQTIVCGPKVYQLILVTAEAPIKDINAKALVVFLTPEDKTDSKVFGFYWMDEQSRKPAYRDNTTGNPGSVLMKYGNGMAGPVSAIQSFFTEANCMTGDPQIASIQTLMGKVTAAPADLRDVARELKSQGVPVDDEQVEDVSAENQILFNGLSDQIGFAKAIRQYVGSVSATNLGRTDEPGGQKLSPEDEINLLKTEHTRLESELTGLRAEKNSFFGGAPYWLLIAFFITSVISLGAIASVAWWHYYPDDTRMPPLVNRRAAFPSLGTDGEATGEQAPHAPSTLAEIIDAAHNRRRSLEAKYASQTGIARNQTVNAKERPANIILRQLTKDKYIRANDYDQVRRILESELGTEGAAANPSQQRGDDWYAAYTELQGQLAELQKGSPEDDGAVVQQITESLGQFATEISAMKSSVDGYDAKLAKYVETNRGLQNIWWRLYGKEYPGGQTDAFVKEVGEAIDFSQFLKMQCSKPGTPTEQTMNYMRVAMEDLKTIRKTYLSNLLGETALLPEIAARIKIKMSRDADTVREYEGIKALLHSNFRQEVTAPEAVTNLMSERTEARKKLGTYHPGLNFIETVDAVAADYDVLAQDVKRALPDESGTVREMVASLATEYQKLKPVVETAQRLEAERIRLQQHLDTARGQLAAGKELVEEIALQLNFKTDHLKEDDQAITRTLDRLKKESETSVYAQLRMGLSSALIVLEKATRADGSDEQTDVIEALHIDKVKKGIQTLLAEMEKYSGEQLWDIGLSEGFSENWLHYLIRADLLLRTYYADRLEFGFLRKAVSLACSALLAALYEFQVEVVEVRLFEELPRDMETEPVYPGVRNLPAVRDKVGLKIMNTQAEEVVVDVTSFPYFVKGVQHNRGRASRANPSAWVQR